MREIINAAIYLTIGIIIGTVIASDLDAIFIILIVVGLLMAAVLVIVLRAESKTNQQVNNRPSYTSHQYMNENAKLNSRNSFSNVGSNSSVGADNNAQISRQQNRQEENELSTNTENSSTKGAVVNKSMPASSTSGKNPTKLVLINEEGDSLLEWSLNGKTSLIIGKSTDKEPVDVDLSGSAVAQMISKQHAVLNYTDNGWYVDDIDSKNGTRIRKKTQNAILDAKLVGAVEVSVGDIIYVANSALILK